MAIVHGFPLGMRQPKKPPKSEKGLYRSWYATWCVNPLCVRRTDPTANPNNDRSMRGDQKPKVCPTCLTPIPKDGYVGAT